MVWRNAGVRRLAVAQSASQIADWAGRLAFAILVFERLNLAWAVGAVGAMFFIAWLGPGQRLTRALTGLGSRGSMVRVELVRVAMFACLALPLTPLNGLTLGVVVLLAALADPVFEINRASLAVEVAGHEYGSAIKLLASVNQVAQLAGYAAGGAVFAVAGERATFLCIAVLFAVSALALFRIPNGVDEAGSEPGGSFVAARAFFADDRLSLIAMLTSLVVVGAAMAIEAIAAVYGSELDLSESGVGLIAAALPSATFLGVAGLKTRAAPIRVLTGALVAAASSSFLGATLFFVGTDLMAALVAYAFVGGALVLSIAGNVVVGGRIPAESRGPVFGVIQGVLYSTMAASAALGGVVAQFIGAKATNIGAAALMATGAVGGLIALRSVPADSEEALV